MLLYYTTIILLSNEGDDGKENYKVRARIAQLDKNFRGAEGIYLEHNHLNEAIDMYQNLFKWEDAIDIAEAKVCFKN